MRARANNIPKIGMYREQAAPVPGEATRQGYIYLYYHTETLLFRNTRNEMLNNEMHSKYVNACITVVDSEKGR